MEVLPISYNYGNAVSSEMDLLTASSIGDLSLVHRLLQQGANVDLQNESGWTPLMYAAHYGHYNVVKMLIDYGANVNITESIQGRTPLMLAASCGHTRCIEVLITLGAADIETTDAQGHNAAYYAIHSGHGRNKIIAKLLKIQGKSRASSSANNNNTSSSVPTSSSVLNSAARTRPLTKGRPDASPAKVTSSSNSNSSSNNNNNNNNNSNGNNNHNKRANVRGQNNLTISSNKVTSTTKPDIIITQENVLPIMEDSSPFSNGNGNKLKNDDSTACDYYSPYLSLNREWSPLGGRQFTPSSPSTSPFCVNNEFTPQLTIDGLLGKRRLPMGNQNDCTRSESRSPLPENLDTLLKRIGLTQYGPLFSSHGIDLYCFLTLNESDFEKIGITLLGHKQKLYMAQLRFRESVEIASTQEQFLADWLLSERENLKKENHELKMKLKGVESANKNLMPLYN